MQVKEFQLYRRSGASGKDGAVGQNLILFHLSVSDRAVSRRCGSENSGEPCEECSEGDLSRIAGSIGSDAAIREARGAHTPLTHRSSDPDESQSLSSPQ